MVLITGSVPIMFTLSTFDLLPTEETFHFHICGKTHRCYWPVHIASATRLVGVLNTGLTTWTNRYCYINQSTASRHDRQYLTSGADLEGLKITGEDAWVVAVCIYLRPCNQNKVRAC